METLTWEEWCHVAMLARQAATDAARYRGNSYFDKIEKSETALANKCQAIADSIRAKHVPGCSFDCDQMPDGRWACQTPIEEI